MLISQILFCTVADHPVAGMHVFYNVIFFSFGNLLNLDNGNFFFLIFGIHQILVIVGSRFSMRNSKTILVEEEPNNIFPLLVQNIISGRAYPSYFVKFSHKPANVYGVKVVVRR